MIGTKQVLIILGVVAIAAPLSFSARADEGRPLPVSCLYLRSQPGEDVIPGKGSVVYQAAFYPALEEELRAAPPDSMAAVALLIDWEDFSSHPLTYTPEHFGELLFQPTEEGNRSMKDYYEEVSAGHFALGGAVSGWLRSSLPYGHYVNGDGTPGTVDDFGFNTTDTAFAAEPYPANVWGIVREAVEFADAGGFDFSLFDNDGPDGVPSSGDDDGILDALIVVHAGTGAERVWDQFLGPSTIWSHKSDMNDPAVVARMGATVVDGIRVGPYNLVPEIGQVGVYAHEFGHILGLPDIYRTYTDEGVTIQQSTVGYYCLMDAGSLLPSRPDGGVLPGASPAHIDPFLKSWLGWLDETAYDGSDGVSQATDVALDPIELGGGAVRLLANPGGPEWNSENARGEYFLLENRAATGFDAFLPGSGMLIWHVNESRPGNNGGDPEGRLLVVVEAEDGVPGDLGEASPLGGTILGEISDFWPYGIRDEWTPDTYPSTDRHGGVFSGISVTEIRRRGEAVLFDLDLELIQPGDPYAYPNPFHPDREEYATIDYVSSEEENEGSPEIRIFDAAGQLVRTLEREGAEVLFIDGGVRAFWNGENDGRREVASGVYFFVISWGKTTKTGKIALLR